MSWRITNRSFFVAPGKTIRISFHWDHPGDKGAQWAMGHPLAGEPSVLLATERVGKKVKSSIASIQQNLQTRFGIDPQYSYWVYYADITNKGTEGCSFQLEGGGVD